MFCPAVVPCCRAEIGDALTAFEQQRQQNSTILQQLTDRDAALNALRAENLTLQQQLEGANDTVRVRPGFSCTGGAVVFQARQGESHANTRLLVPCRARRPTHPQHSTTPHARVPCLNPVGFSIISGTGLLT